MKSKLFLDTQGLDLPFFPSTPEKISVCLRISRESYYAAVQRAQGMGISVGEYMEFVLKKEEEESGKKPLW